jgi:hypothetical protein
MHIVTPTEITSTAWEDKQASRSSIASLSRHTKLWRGRAD